MEVTREIYWNVGHGVVLPMYLLSFLAVGILLWGFWQRLPFYRTGKALNRFDRYEERVGRMIGEVIGQEKVLRVKSGGLPHNLFFWGFGVLFIGTLLVMLQADFFTPLMGVNLLSGEFYKAFSLILDIAGLIVFVMLAALFIRRYFIKPEGLETKDDDIIIHTLLFGILITGFLIEGARMAATEIVQQPALANYSPVGKLVAQAFMGLTDQSILTCHKTFWWIHLGLVIGFIAAIPFTKLRHIFTTSANAYFAPSGGKRGHKHHQHGRRNLRTVRRRPNHRPHLERHLRRRRLHAMQTVSGSLPGLHHRQTALPHEAYPADWRNCRNRPRASPVRNSQRRRPLVLHHLPRLPGHLSSQ